MIYTAVILMMPFNKELSILVRNLVYLGKHLTEIIERNSKGELERTKSSESAKNNSDSGSADTRPGSSKLQLWRI